MEYQKLGFSEQAIYTTSFQQQAPPIVNQPFTDFPQRHVCQFCGSHIVTETETKAGLLTWLTSGIICLVGGGCGCCLIPFCVDALKDTVHYCPNCERQVGKYSPVK
eukprot:TRINITY_DN4742_c0_g1_i1.p1 TRINITY_DN4742_c0_g1~~TRINITY_DN4742_c0_g1_i1.p1  ORF type:complete len:122 (-),score=14.46 TRINITY_DN4742_c0_g1_i1:86-403(-)